MILGNYDDHQPIRKFREPFKFREFAVFSLCGFLCYVCATDSNKFFTIIYPSIHPLYPSIHPFSFGLF